VKEFTRVRALDRLPDRATDVVTGTIGRFDTVYALSVAFALTLTLFLAVEPTQNWILLLLCGLVTIGTDHVVRSHPKARFQRLDDTALYLFVPVLFTLGLGLFLEEVATGHWTIAAGLVSAVPFGALLRAEYDSVDRDAPTYQKTRLVLNLATYVIAFLFFATIYDFDLSLLGASFAAGIVSFMLAIEVLREEAMDTYRTILYALAIGVLLGETAWTTHFLPLEGSSAAVFLLLALYLMTGMMHNYLANRLSLRTASEFCAVALAGLFAVIVSHSYI
jgi:hypothetical protein